MNSVGAAVVVALMALRAVSTTEAPIQTTPETPIPMTTEKSATACPTISGCEGPYCSVNYNDGCPYCLCGDPICVFVRCPPGRRCVMTKEDPYYSCVSDGSDTTSATSTTPTVLTTIECPIYTCAGQCTYFTDIDGCYKCECVPFTSTPSTTPSPSTTAECPVYTCAGQCTYFTDIDGCYKCECVPFTSTTSNTPSPPTTTECPRFTCSGNCHYFTDSNGCYNCECFPFTSTPSTTPSTTPPILCYYPTCVGDCRYGVDSNGCYTCDCVPFTTTPSRPPTPWCPMVTCFRGCRYVIDSNGCPNCDCPPPSCEGITCAVGDRCELVATTCYPWENTCYPQPVCVPDGTTTPCPTVTCATGCELDNFARPCPTCACPPTCEGFYCSDGYECRLVDVDCFRAPCFPQPECQPVTDPCTGSPNKGRCGGAINRWTYNSLTNNTCEKFVYYGCTPSPNTFSSRKACKNRCKPACAAVVCEPDCYTFTRKNKCTKCICPNPCEGLRCRAGFECKMRETKCGTTAEPYCSRVRNFCPPPEPCAIRCAYGLKTDKNGCQLCECLTKPLPSVNPTPSS